MMDIQQLQTQTKQECDELRKTAIAECHAIQTDADTYADQVLQRMETQFSEMLGVISNGRQQLYDRQQRARQTSPTPLSDPAPAAAPRRPTGPPTPQRPAAPQQSYIQPPTQQPPQRPQPRRKF